MKSFLLILSALVSLQITSPLLAPARAAETTDEVGGARKRWSEMSEEDRQRLRENYRHWKGMPEDRQRALTEKFKRFQTMNPQARERILRNFRAFQRLNPEQREKIRTRFQKFMRLDPSERQRRLELLRKRRGARLNPANPAGQGQNQDRPRFRRRFRQ